MITAFEETTTGCKGNSMKAKIRIISSPAINLGKFKTICKGDQMELDPGKGYSRYLWHNGSTNPSFITDTAGTYWVEVTNQNECTIRDSIEIMVIPLPKINLGNDTMLCATNELLLDAGDKGTFYKWSNGVTSQTIIAHEGDGQIWVKVSDANGCVGTDTIQILHCSKQQKLEIANAFTPNGDGHNDYWQIEGYQNYPDMTVKVFDRWGIEVFSSEHGYFKPWDGTIGGKNLPTGAYYYIIKLGDGSKEITGSLTLIR
jgi:gliding motility-associated-like protein